MQSGRKINLATVEIGKPADAERFLLMLERRIGWHGQPPCQIASDDGYASTANLTQAKALGVSNVAFHKKCRLDIEAMVKSRWVYRKLRNFHAGIEANISCLKRAFGLARCMCGHRVIAAALEPSDSAGFRALQPGGSASEAVR